MFTSNLNVVTLLSGQVTHFILSEKSIFLLLPLPLRDHERRQKHVQLLLVLILLETGQEVGGPSFGKAHEFVSVNVEAGSLLSKE